VRGWKGEMVRPLPGVERIEVGGLDCVEVPRPSSPLTLPSPRRGEGMEVRA
jgi:hypothetical protein